METNMTEQEMMSVIYEETEDWERVTRDEIGDQGRWHTQWSAVFKRKSDGSLFEFWWSRGSTECQDCEPYPSAYEVVPVEVTVTQYQPVVGGEKIKPTE